MNYDNDVELAISSGFARVDDPSAYKGCYYVKNGKKWIHNIEALKKILEVSTDEGLVLLDYDVESYYNKYSNSYDTSADPDIPF